MVGRLPQDQLFGPLTIPDYCWQIIDTPEFQRLRYVAVLGLTAYVYPSATHTRFEHSLGCCHLAVTLMNRLRLEYPDLHIEENHMKAVTIAALCHDLGQGPFSHAFLRVAQYFSPQWDWRENSQLVLKFLIEKHGIDFPSDVIDAACYFISGRTYSKYPSWLSQIVRNAKSGVDICTFDHLARDINKTICACKFPYDRLLSSCRVVNGELCWKASERPSIEDLFARKNDMFLRVYFHRVVQSLEQMLLDIFRLIADKIQLENILESPSDFVKLDERVLMDVENGYYGEEPKKLVQNIALRRIYKLVGETYVRIEPEAAYSFSQKDPAKIADDIANADPNSDFAKYFRPVVMRHVYGISSVHHPLLSVPFWKSGAEISSFRLRAGDLSAMDPHSFQEVSMQLFVTDPDLLEQAQAIFKRWRGKKSCPFEYV
jgi:HD superfamily phosphohydrolase